MKIYDIIFCLNIQSEVFFLIVHLNVNKMHVCSKTHSILLINRNLNIFCNNMINLFWSNLYFENFIQ